MKNKEDNLREIIFSSKKTITLFEGRVRETEYFPSTTNEYTREVENLKNNKSKDVAIFYTKGLYFSKKKRKGRIQQLRHIIPTSSNPSTELTSQSSFSFKTTKVRKIFLITCDQNKDRLDHPSNSMTQYLTTLVLHDGKDDVIQKFRYSLEFMPEKKLIKLSGWSISQKKISRINGYLRRVINNNNTDFQFQNYYLSHKLGQFEYKMHPMNDEQIEVDEMMQQATAIKSNLLAQLENMVNDRSKTQRILQESQQQSQVRLPQNIINEVVNLQDENNRLQEVLLREEKKAEEESRKITKEESLDTSLPNPQQPSTIEGELNVNLNNELDTTENALEIKARKEKELLMECEELKNNIGKIRLDESDLLLAMDRLKKKTAKRILVANKFGSSK